MTKEQLLELRTKLSKLSREEQKLRDIYLRDLSIGFTEGPLTGIPSIDKPWLKQYTEDEVLADFPEMNMKEFIKEKNKDNKKGIAINYYGNKITYEELFKNIEDAKKSFYLMGIRNGDVVSLAAPFLPETVYSVYALNALGATVNVLDPRVPEDKLKDYLKGANSKYLIAYASCLPKIQNIEEECELKKTVLISATDSLPGGLKLLSNAKEMFKKNPKLTNKYVKWNDMIKQNKKEAGVIDAPYTKDKPAVIVYTSGTSGEPKGAISSNESFNNIAVSQAISLQETKVGDKFLLIMPPFIAYGIAIGMHGQLSRGQELLMIPSFSIEKQKEMLGNLIYKHKPQTVMGVPTFMADLIKHPKMQNLDLSFLKTIIVGGDSMIPASEVLVNEFMESHNSTARICKGWGLTEVNSAFSYTNTREDNEIGSVGVPLIGNNIKVMTRSNSDVVDFSSLEELGYNETGELYINSTSVILDYLNNEKESKSVFYTDPYTNERWIRTKDLGRITENGIIYIDGRMKRIIIRPDGHNIAPFAIENIINMDERVEACGVVPKPVGEGEHGAYAVAYIKIKEQYKFLQNLIVAELKKKVEDTLPPRDVASEYKVIDELPLTRIGKVDYLELEKREKELVLKKEKK